MSALDLERIGEVWRDLPDVEVVRGLRRAEDFPPAVLAIIRAEAERRALDLEAFGPEALANPDVVPRAAAAVRVVAVMLGRKVPRLCRRWPMVGGVCVGVGTSLLGYLLPAGPNRFGQGMKMILIVGASLTGLVSVCWPLRRYGVALRASVGAMLGSVAFVLLFLLLSLGFRGVAPLVWVFVLASWLVVTGALPFGLLCAVVWTRNRYWPIYAAGRCARCGYDLRGLTQPRCPECWTPFVMDGLEVSGGG